MAMCAFAYLYAFPYTPALNNPNENVRLYMTSAMVEEGTYQIDTLRKRWGWVNDAGVRGEGKDKHFYSVKAPGTSWLGAVGYGVYYYAFTGGGDVDFETALWASRFTASILPMLLFLFFLYRWYHTQPEPPVVAEAAFVTVALGSVLFGYSLMYASHATSAACAFGAFMILYDARHRGSLSHPQAFLAGLLVAGITFFEYPGFVISLFLSLYALFCLRPLSRFIPFAIAGLIPTLLVMHFQWSAFGDPLTPGHLFVENPAFRAGHEEGFYGATHFRTEAAYALLFDMRLGLLTLTPFLLLAFVGFGRLLSRAGERLDAAFVLLLCIALYVLICSMNLWNGGWSIGPRYLVQLIPFLAWAAMRGVGPLVKRAPVLGVGLVTGLVLAGLVASGIPSLYYPHLPGFMDRPLADLFGVLIANGFSPSNIGSYLGVYGNISMLPLLVVGVVAVFGLILGGLPLRRRLPALGVALLVATALLWPQVTRTGPKDPEARDFVKFVVENWYPAGHDKASSLEQGIATGKTKDPQTYLRLANIYFREGRESEAQAALQRGLEALRK